MAYRDREDLNYRGMLFLVGQNRTPTLNLIGGLTGRSKNVSSFLFPLTRSYDIPAASQDVTSETLAAAEGTATTHTMSQAYNAVQIHKLDVAVTYASESVTGEFSGLNVDGSGTPVAPMDEQKMVTFKKLARDINYSFINGSYVDPSTSGTVGKTRGILEAITTNAVAAGGAALSTDLFNEAIRALAAYTAPQNLALITGIKHKQELNNLYGFAPTSINVGGLSLNYLYTDLGNLPIVFDPDMPVGSIAFVDIAACQPVFVPFKSKTDGNVYTVNYEKEYLSGAVQGGFFYTQIGLDYGHETQHAKITGLATS